MKGRSLISLFFATFLFSSTNTPLPFHECSLFVSWMVGGLSNKSRNTNHPLIPQQQQPKLSTVLTWLVSMVSLGIKSRTGQRPRTYHFIWLTITSIKKRVDKDKMVATSLMISRVDVGIASDCSWGPWPTRTPTPSHHQKRRACFCQGELWSHNSRHNHNGEMEFGQEESRS